MTTKAEWHNKLQGRSLYLLVNEATRVLPVPFTNIGIRDHLEALAKADGFFMNSRTRQQLLQRVARCTEQLGREGRISREKRRNEVFHTDYYAMTPCSAST